MIRINTRADLIAFAKDVGVRPDWHEPDEQGLTAYVAGTPLDFDNAGFWPAGPTGYGAGGGRSELHVILCEKVIEDGVARRGRDLAAVNLATLFSWACGSESAEQYAVAEAARLRRLIADLALSAGVAE